MNAPVNQRPYLPKSHLGQESSRYKTYANHRHVLLLQRCAPVACLCIYLRTTSKRVEEWRVSLWEQCQCSILARWGCEDAYLQSWIASRAWKPDFLSITFHVHWNNLTSYKLCCLWTVSTWCSKVFMACLLEYQSFSSANSDENFGLVRWFHSNVRVDLEEIFTISKGMHIFDGRVSVPRFRRLAPVTILDYCCVVVTSRSSEEQMGVVPLPIGKPRRGTAAHKISRVKEQVDGLTWVSYLLSWISGWLANFVVCTLARYCQENVMCLLEQSRKLEEALILVDLWPFFDSCDDVRGSPFMYLASAFAPPRGPRATYRA